MLKAEDRTWTAINAQQLFDISVQRETKVVEPSTDNKNYGNQLWTFISGTFLYRSTIAHT